MIRQGERRTRAIAGRAASATGIAVVFILALVRSAGADSPPTLAQLTSDADVVVRARIVEGSVALSAADAASQWPIVRAERLESWKGDAPPSVLFAQCGTTQIAYAPGEVVALFLWKSARVRAFSGASAATQIEWVSFQGAPDKLTLAPSDAALPTAIRAYVAVGALPTPESRLEAFRRVTVQHLRSGDPRLAAWAVRNLEIAANAPLVTTAEMPLLDPLIDDPALAIDTRIALLAELERRQLVFAPPRWGRLLRQTPLPDLLAVVRAAGAHPSTGVTIELERALDRGDDTLATAAALALGSPGNESAVRSLADAVNTRDWPLRQAALRALGRIGTQQARHALELAAVFHPDPQTRQRATVEVIMLARRQGTTLAPTIVVPTTNVAIALPDARARGASSEPGRTLD